MWGTVLRHLPSHLSSESGSFSLNHNVCPLESLGHPKTFSNSPQTLRVKRTQLMFPMI